MTLIAKILRRVSTARAQHGPIDALYDCSHARGLRIIDAVSKAQTDFETNSWLRQAMPGGIIASLCEVGLWDWLVMRLTFTSNAIEGNALTQEEVASILSTGAAVSHKVLADQEDIAAHARGMELLVQLASRGTIPVQERGEHIMQQLSSADLRRLHALAIPAGKYNQPGVYRDAPRATLSKDGNEKSSLLLYPPPSHAAADMSDLFQWLNNHEGVEHPLLTAAVCHYNVARAHPFGDGNGRMARMLMNCVLLRAGYLPSIIEPARKMEYFAALHSADHKRSLVPLVQLIGEGVINALDECRLKS